MKNMLVSLRLFILMTAITGIIYPLLITGFAQAVFKDKADGSIIVLNDKKKGSRLIGQEFVSDRYFWGRPSASVYNTVPSGASNLAPTSKALKESADIRKKLFDDADNIPPDLLYASGSGLDPHISPEAAYFQAERIAKVRNFDKLKTERLMALIGRYVEKRDLNILGKERVNILMLNIALDDME